MVAIEHRPTSANTSTNILSPTSNSSATSTSTTPSAASTSLSILSNTTANIQKKMSSTSDASKSAISQRDIDLKVPKKKSSSHKDVIDGIDLSKKVLRLDLSRKDSEEYSLKSPKSPVVGMQNYVSSKCFSDTVVTASRFELFILKCRLSQQTPLSSSVDVEDRKTLREALYQGIFHRHRRTIFAVGSFLRMLRSRNSQYNTIRSSSEGEDIDKVR